MPGATADYASAPTSAGLYATKGSEYFDHTRRAILPLLPEVFHSVADLGGGSGATLSLIKQRFPASETVCIDRHVASVAKARERGHVGIVCDLDREVPQDISNCDVVLCLDILEHLFDPWTVLKTVHQRLKPGAVLIASIPNVRYLPVSAGLLFRGRWDLRPSGVLDDTHLRFFTRGSAVSLMQGAGFHLTRLVSNLGPSRRVTIADALTLGLLRDLLAIQYLLVGTC